MNDKARQKSLKTQPFSIHSLANSSKTVPTDTRIDQVINVNRIGSLTKLLRVTALVIKFVTKLKKWLKTENAKDNDHSEDFLNSSELNKAEQSVQAESLPKELQFLRSNDNKVDPPVYVSQFGLFLGEGIIKCKGRVNNSSSRIGLKNPVFLPSKHPFVQLVIKNVHNSIMHFDVSQTLTALRERYWVIRGREAVKGIVKGCVICRRYEGTSYKSLPTANLPIERVSDDPPFTHIGLDFAGPLSVSSSNSSKTIQDTIRAYICLFTCASTRAIHLELARGLDVQSFLLAFRRYSIRRGLLATITSDNAEAFKASCNEIRRITRFEEVSQFLSNRRITWNIECATTRNFCSNLQGSGGKKT